MDDEYVIGFDCREMWLPGVKDWSFESRAVLLKPDIEKELRVARREWHSFFTNSSARVDGEWVNTVPGYSFKIPDVLWTADGFWHDLDQMRAFVAEHKSEFREPFWMIAITIVETKWVTEQFEDSSKHYFWYLPERGDLEPTDVDPAWKFLGYDVQNAGVEFGKGLGGFYPGPIQDELRETWGRYLNKYDLFDDREPANQFAYWKDENEAGAGPFFIYGLYRIDG